MEGVFALRPGVLCCSATQDPLECCAVIARISCTSTHVSTLPGGVPAASLGDRCPAATGGGTRILRTWRAVCGSAGTVPAAAAKRLACALPPPGTRASTARPGPGAGTTRRSSPGCTS